MENTKEQAPEATVIFLFPLKNWYDNISQLSKLDLIDIAPLIATQFYLDFGIQAYVLLLTKTKWDTLDKTLKRRFMFISRTLKEQMDSPMNPIEKEKYENSDIFELLMPSTQEQLPISLNTNDEEEIINVPE